MKLLLLLLSAEEAPPVADIKLQPQLMVMHYVGLLSDEVYLMCCSVAASCHVASDPSGSG